MRTVPTLLAACSSLAIVAAAAPARADASAWLFIGGGTFGWKQGSFATRTLDNDGVFAANGTMTIDVGAGTTPDARFIFGGLFRIQPIFKHGADLALLGRVCTHGFQAGDFGVALDAGGYLRTWGPVTGAGLAFGVSVGLPLGFTVALHSEVGTNQAVAFGAVAGIDLLRLTLYRQTLLKWWQNPSPAWTRQTAAGPAVTF